MSELYYTYIAYYVKAAARFWASMGPAEYGSTLIIIGLIGWWLMRGQLRK